MVLHENLRMKTNSSQFTAKCPKKNQMRCSLLSTCCPDNLSLDALVKLTIRQLPIIPVAMVQMDTPWTDSGGESCIKV